MLDIEAIKIIVREEHKEEFEKIESEILELIIENNKIRNENNELRKKLNSCMK